MNAMSFEEVQESAAYSARDWLQEAADVREEQRQHYWDDRLDTFPLAALYGIEDTIEFDDLVYLNQS
jgi:hypothetical protein